jgi:tryptophan 2,3-dioxygenase
MSDYGKNPALSYNKYLKVPQLIELQETLSEPQSHDELLFIVIHQTYELWFKQILHELDASISWLNEDRLFRANHSLNPASGFQSMQFREIEFLSGAKDEHILNFFKFDEFAHERLQKRFDAPNLADIFWKLLETKGFDAENRVESIVEILTNPEKYAELYVLQDLLIDHDENISLWRSHHVAMVERMMGFKRGTGGSDGVGYLRSTLSKRFFPEIWEARTALKVLS